MCSLVPTHERHLLQRELSCSVDVQSLHELTLSEMLQLGIQQLHPRLAEASQYFSEGKMFLCVVTDTAEVLGVLSC